jgi:signal transduction protein with GAF and PtsI domain
MLISCGNNEELKTEMTVMKSKMDSTSSEINNQDAMLSGIRLSLSVIYSNLFEINRLETELKLELKKGSKKDEELIKVKVDMIRDMMKRNDIYVEEVQSSIGDEESTIAYLIFQALHGVQSRILTNNLRIAYLNNDLGEMGDDYKFLFDEFLDAEMGKWNAENELASQK